MDYITEVQKYFQDTNSSEMSYRTSFQNFLETIFKKEDKYFIQHDQKAIDGNKPDFIILKDKVPVLYIEVKKVGEDLNKIEKSNQADRYFGYDNLIISDYVNFRFYRYGKKYEEEISLGEIDNKSKTISLKENFDILIKTILDFTNSHKEEIKSGRHLAEIMGGKAVRIKENVLFMLSDQKERYEELDKIKRVIQENLIPSLSDEDFADMYAQTLVYGLFAARYNDKSSENFSRLEALELAPKTNPFLKSFFGHIAGVTFPERLRFIVDELCEVFTHADIHKLLTDFYGKEKDNRDPVIHFYEDFLHEYDAKKKMEMGVFYTPKPVVDFIVRGVDEILKTEFDISDGLADKSEIEIEKREQNNKGKEIKVKKNCHKVQILDIATGTGTFLNQTVEHIYKSFAGQKGKWGSYVEEHLLPRLHGFELMMASYTIAHLKLSMTLSDTGATNTKHRIGIYLTNSLDEAGDTSHQANMFTLLGVQEAISVEARLASEVKKDYPIMCVIGNPPYSGISQNKDFTLNNDYKVEIGGEEKLKERKNWLDDDYVKFIRFGESLIEKNGEGILAMITAHGYIDNPTFRGMRWHLRKTFDKIYILDLHGNARKKEVSPDGSKDENVFDIMTGVSIIFGIKKQNSKNKNLSEVYKADLYGTRVNKLETLNDASLGKISWQKLPQDTDLWVQEGKGKAEYMKGFSVAEIFVKNTTGIVTGIDKLSIFNTEKELKETVKDILNTQDPFTKYKIKDTRRTTKEGRIEDLRQVYDKGIIKINYRPFDVQYTLPFDKNEYWINSPRTEMMSNFINKENLGFCFQRGSGSKNELTTPQVTKNIIDQGYCFPATSALSVVGPLYIYENNEKVPNLDKQIWNKINEIVGKTEPEDIIDYIYAVLHSPEYRKKYKEFLKIDFPRVPYPTDKNKFWELVKIGTKLRELHLMTDKSVNDFITTFDIEGSNEVEKIRFEITDKKNKIGNVYINKEQYFGDVPEGAWEFYIGGYQPAQKYLKDRKGRTLSNDEIDQYQRIVKVLEETGEVMRGIKV